MFSFRRSVVWKKARRTALSSLRFWVVAGKALFLALFLAVFWPWQALGVLEAVWGVSEASGVILEAVQGVLKASWEGLGAVLGPKIHPRTLQNRGQDGPKRC